MRHEKKKYFDLIEDFPLVRIFDEATYTKAKGIAEHLRSEHEHSRLTVEEFEYLDILEMLIDAYAPKKQIAFDGNPLRTLARLMRERGWTPADLIEISGEHKTNVSAVLNGKRNISKSVAQILAAEFNVDPDIFLPKMDLPARAEIYLSGGPFNDLRTNKIIADKMNTMLKSGLYELVPYSYKAGFPPYYPLFIWVPAAEPRAEDFPRLEFEIEQTYAELTQYAYAYKPNNLEERQKQCMDLLERLGQIKQANRNVEAN